MSMTPRSLQISTAAAQKPFNGVYLYKYDFRTGDGVKFRLPRKNSRNPESIENVLAAVTKALELPRPAKQLFREDDEPITKYSELVPHMKVFVSCTAQYQEETLQDQYRSRIPKSSIGPKTLPSVTQPKYEPKPEDAAQHQAIASSPFTVRENLRDSLLSLYCSLQPGHAAQLSCAAALQKLHQDTQAYMIEDSLLSQFIGPNKVIFTTELGQYTTSWAMDRLKQLTPSDCTFTVTGPRQSGKTTILSILVSLFYQKLLLSSDTHKYLLFPINWQLQHIYLEDISKLYSLVIQTILHSLRYQRMEFIPIINILHQWLISILEMPVFPPIPPSISRFTNFPALAVQKVAQRIHELWNKKTGFSEFILEIFRLPNSFANVFDFTSAVYVYDHFDLTLAEIHAPPKFEGSKSVNLPRVLQSAMNGCPFFVASLDDADFFKCFNTECISLTTEHLVEDPDEKFLNVVDPAFNLSSNQCMGCPGYLAHFEKIIGMIQDINEKPQYKGPYAKVRSVVDIAKNELLKQEFCRLCMNLMDAADDEIDPDVLNELNARQEIELTLH